MAFDRELRQRILGMVLMQLYGRAGFGMIWRNTATLALKKKMPNVVGRAPHISSHQVDVSIWIQVCIWRHLKWHHPGNGKESVHHLMKTLAFQALLGCS